MRMRCLSTLAGAVLWPVMSQAAILWQTPQNIAGDTDVVLQGQLLGAYSFAYYTSGTAVSNMYGIVFRSIQPNSTYGHLATSGLDGTDSVFGSTSDPYTSLSYQYRNLLSFADFDDSNFASPTTLSLIDLTPETTYLVQIWASDSRPGTYREQILSSPGGTNSAPMTFREGTAGSLGQYIIGTFTTGIGMTTQDITFATNSLQVNALQVRVIPEPGTGLGAALMAALVAGCVRHRRPAGA